MTKEKKKKQSNEEHLTQDLKYFHVWLQQVAQALGELGGDNKKFNPAKPTEKQLEAFLYLYDAFRGWEVVTYLANSPHNDNE